jgi:hypothetical protein
MDRVLKMLDGSEAERTDAYLILLGMKSRARLAEMERKFEMVGTEAGRKALAGAILNNRRWIEEARR